MANQLCTELKEPVPETNNGEGDTHRSTTDKVALPKSTSIEDDVLKPMGFSFMFPEAQNLSIPVQESTPFENSTIAECKGYEFSINSLKELILNPNKTTKVRPVLISFSGLPESGKTKAVNHILDNYVNDSPLEAPITKRTEKQEAAGISYYELVAAGLNPLKDLCFTEVTQESSLAAGVLSALKNDVSVNGQIPLFSLTTTELDSRFQNFDLEDHLHFIYRFLCKQESIPKGPKLEDKEKEYGAKLKRLLPNGIALINIWDLSINETVRHFLTALCGHLYNNHCWLFLDLDKDLDHLNEPPVIKEKDGRNDGAVYMKWRPRLHYMLRFCRMSENKNKEKQRKRMCTIFAKHEGASNEELLKKVDKLEEKVQPVAKHIGFSQLLEEKIQTINLSDRSGNTDNYSRRLYQKFQNVVFETPFEDIPLAWVFLRSFLHRYKKKFILRDDLKEMAKECGMDDKSFEDFCKFYTSFGSIFDLNLIDPEYPYVIIKPIEFLKSLDSCLRPDNDKFKSYPIIKYGIFPQKACKQVFGGDWPVIIDALISLNLAIKLTGPLIEDQTSSAREDYYYISVSRSHTAPLVTHVDQNSIHVITDIDTPHVFKQVKLTEKLLDSLGDPKLVPCEYMNQTIIKDDSTGTILTIVSHSPATRLHLDQPNLEVCFHIVEAYQYIARSCDVATKYKFVVLCVDGIIPNVQSIPSSHYHILPDNNLCEECRKAGLSESELLKVWNKALTNCPIDECSKPTGGLKVTELAVVSEKIAFFNIKAQVLVDVFEMSDQFKEFIKKPVTADDKIAIEIILAWYKFQCSCGNKEIKRSFAKKLSELGDKTAWKEECEKMAKDMDIYY